VKSRNLFAIVMGLTCLIAVGLSVPAHAASQEAAVNCVAAATSNISLEVGDTLTIATTTPCDRVSFVFGVGTVTFGLPPGTPVPMGDIETLTSGAQVIYTATTPGTAVVVVYNSSNPGLFGSDASFIITVTSGGGGAAASVSGPAPIVQQFGRPTSATCQAAAPANLNWSGVPGTGWGESWSQWMNNGRGGAICTRTLVYSNSLGRWIVG